MTTPSNFELLSVNPNSRPKPCSPAYLKRQIYTDPSVFRHIDEHAISEARTNYRTFRDLIWNLVFKRNFNQLEKARAIFRWMTTKNMYTIIFDGELPGSPEQIISGFKDGKTTYSKIYECMCCYAGLHCVAISGWAKGVDYRPGMPLTTSPVNHSWNAVYIDGSWQLVDCHWATRYLQSERNVPENLVYEYDDFYFLTEPAELVYSHCPESAPWQLLARAKSKAEFEDLPLAKSFFFTMGMLFLQQNCGIVYANRGVATLTLGFTVPSSFTFKLSFGDTMLEAIHGVNLKRYVIQETTEDGRVTFFFRAPREGNYYLTVFAQFVGDRLKLENVFKAACEYKIICDQAASDIRPYPQCSDANWGPGSSVGQCGLVPSHKTAILVAPNGQGEIVFTRKGAGNHMRIHPRLVKDGFEEEVLDQCVVSREQDNRIYVSVFLPSRGEYGLEIYVNDPDVEGDTFTHMCQYLVSYTERDFGTLYGQVFDRADMVAPGGAATALPAMYAVPEGVAMAKRAEDKMRQLVPPSGRQVREEASRDWDGNTMTSRTFRDVTDSDPAGGYYRQQTTQDTTPHAYDVIRTSPITVDDTSMLDSADDVGDDVTRKTETYSSSQPQQGRGWQSHDLPPPPADMLDPRPSGTGQTARQEALHGARIPSGQFGERPHPDDADIYEPYATKSATLPSHSAYPQQGGQGQAPAYGAPRQSSTLPPGANPAYGQPYGSAPNQPYGSGSNQPYGSGSNQPYGSAPNQPYGSGSNQPYGSGSNQPYGSAPNQPYGSAGQQPYGSGPNQSYGPAYGGQQPYGAGDSGTRSVHMQPPSTAPPPPPAAAQESNVPQRARPTFLEHYPFGEDSQTFAYGAARLAEPEQEYKPHPQKVYTSSIVINPPQNFAPRPVEKTSEPKPQPPSVPPRPFRDTEVFHNVDTHAVEVSKLEHGSFRELVWHLIYARDITNELEKARAIFLWLCSKDLTNLNFSNVAKGSPEEILVSLREGRTTYAVVYETLCSYAGLHCRTLSGYAKGAEYRPGMKFTSEQGQHSWNAVLVNGAWRLVDCHWAARRLVGRKVAPENVRYELDEYYFMPDPHQLIFTHYPDDANWQLLERVISLADFEHLVPVKSAFFKYGLQILSHREAVIKTNREVTVRIGCPSQRAQYLAFTFTLTTEDGSEELGGVKMNRFGMQETLENIAFFTIRPPQKGSYRLIIYAKDNSVQTMKEGVYGGVCEYEIACDVAPHYPLPFPPCVHTSWGPGDSAARYGLTPLQKGAIFSTVNGLAEVRFAMPKELRFTAKLKSNAYDEKELQGYVLHRLVGDVAVFTVTAPARGEFGLEVYANDAEVDGTSLYHVYQYLIICPDMPAGGGKVEPLPLLPAGYLGPQPNFRKFGLQNLGYQDPFIQTDAGVLELTFATSAAQPVRMTAQLLYATANRNDDCSDYILQQGNANKGTVTFVLRFSRVGLYKLQVYALPYSDPSESLPGVFNYLINSLAVPSAAVPPFPKQYGQWKEGCFLLEPLDGHLVQNRHARTSQGTIHFRLAVPSAKAVGVVIGEDWSHLEQANGIWEGEVPMSDHWGKEHRLSVCANYGAVTSSYSTLLEYTL